MERMDFDIGSLLYIVVTVIAVVVGIAGKKKKTKTVSPDESSGKSPKPGFFGKLEAQLESFAVEAKSSLEKLPQQPVQEDVEDVEEMDYFDKLNSDYASYKAGEESAAFEGLYSPDDEQNEILIESEGISTTGAMELEYHNEDDARDFDHQEIVENFDLQKAVIYSTIINRIEI